MPDLYPNVDRALRARIVALESDAATLNAAVGAYLAGTTTTVDFVYAQIRTMALEARSIAESLTAMDDVGLVDGIHRIREIQRWLLRLYASPEIVGKSLESQAADYAARGGPSYLGGLVIRKLKRYMVCDGDTPQSVAQVQLGDAARWQEIVLLNALTFPFFTDDDGYQASARATGIVRFRHVSVQEDDYTIPAGTRVSTAPSDDRPAVVFETTEDIVIEAGELYADGPVVAVDAGPAGNVGPAEITVIESLAAEKPVYAYSLSVQGVDVAGNYATAERAFRHQSYPVVTNPEATSGGASGNVARTGAWILLPIESEAPRTPDILQFDNFANPTVRQYGVDWWLSDAGELDRDSTGDARAVGGLDNLAVALWCKLQTERGDLTWHPDYGSDLRALIGGLNRATLPDEVMLAVRRAALQDPRVKSAYGVLTSHDVHSLAVTVTYEVEEQFDPGTLNLVVRPTA